MSFERVLTYLQLAVKYSAVSCCLTIFSLSRSFSEIERHFLLENRLTDLPCKFHIKSLALSKVISFQEADNTFTSDGLSRHIVTKRHLFWTCVVSHESLDHCRSLTDVTGSLIGPLVMIEKGTANRN